jgi:hypothetical protein
MKLAAAFIVLLAVALLALPAQMTGDGTLAGQIRAFLAYGTGIALGLLSIMTIFVGASMVSNDIRTKQIFTVAVKPLARWQYLLGRWVGLVLFDTMLLFLACAAIYATAEHLRTKETTSLGRVSVSDRRAVETEVFAARRQIKPDPLPLETVLSRRVEQLKTSGQYQSALEGWMTRANGDERQAERMLLSQLQRQIGGKLQSIASNGTMDWTFSNVNVAGHEIHEKAHVVTPLDKAGFLQLRMPESFACRLWMNGPVRVNGLDARVAATDGHRVVVGFAKTGNWRQRVSGLVAGDTVDILVEPILQIAYKLTPTDHKALPNGKFQGMWQVTDGTGPGLRWSWLPDVKQQRTTVSTSSRMVGEDGRLVFSIHNASPTSAEVLHRDVTLLYNVGAFESNFVRASALMLCQLAYLAAVSIFAGSFVSFPVACLLCFTLVPFSLARTFLTEAVSLSLSGETDVMTLLAHHVFKPINMLLPDFARTMPGDRLVEGMDISWAFVGDTAMADVLIRAGVTLLLACLVFHRRELARVQV